MYGKGSDGVSFCPNRVSPLGALIDHQYGIINGFAIDRGIDIDYGIKKNGVVELQYISYPKKAQFHVMLITDTKAGDWTDHMRGVTKRVG